MKPERLGKFHASGRAIEESIAICQKKKDSLVGQRYELKDICRELVKKGETIPNGWEAKYKYIDNQANIKCKELGNLREIKNSAR